MTNITGIDLKKELIARGMHPNAEDFNTLLAFWQRDASMGIDRLLSIVFDYGIEGIRDALITEEDNFNE